MNDSAALSIAVLFENADVVVKGVLLLLLGGSVWSWAVRAADARTTQQVMDERISAEANQPAGALLAVGVEESIAFDNEPESVELRLPFLATLGSAAPFIGLFGTVWSIMGSFNAIAAANNTNSRWLRPASPPRSSRRQWALPQRSPRSSPTTCSPSRSAALRA